MSATLSQDCNLTQSGLPQETLYLALELGWSEWKLAFTVGFGQSARRRTIAARDLGALLQEVEQARRRFKLSPTAPVVCCYEAGRDGFWIQRTLERSGVRTYVVDSSSIEVNRRARRAKSDRLDAEKLLAMLLRYCHGETKLWSVVRVPTVEDEDARQLHRELGALRMESTQHINRIRGLLASYGLELKKVDKHFPKRLKELRQYDGSPVPPQLLQRLLREFERLQVVNRQVRDLERARIQQCRQDAPAIKQVRLLLQLRGIGLTSAWLYVREFFSWRQIKNRRQLASLAGLTPTPYASGEMKHEQGINQRVRGMAVEIAWLWLRFQPQSQLSQWYVKRFALGNSRQRRIGIVALARKVLVALWKFVTSGEVPQGAELCDEQVKLKLATRSLETV